MYCTIFKYIDKSSHKNRLNLLNYFVLKALDEFEKEMCLWEDCFLGFLKVSLLLMFFLVAQ